MSAPKDMFTISVIVPVYNTSKYIVRCLDSIVEQSIKNIEIICVNDGSTDDSLAILQQYSAKHENVRIVSQENKGAMAARKNGLAYARGVYVGFVDSDDWIEPQMYEKLLECIIKYPSEIVSSGYYYEGNYVTEHYDDIPEGFYTSNNINEVREKVIYNTSDMEVGMRGSLCTKLFNRVFLEKVFSLIPSTLSFSEDKMCIITSVLFANSVYVLQRCFYHYIKRKESIVNTEDRNYLIKVNEVYDYFHKLYSYKEFTDSMRVQSEIYLTELLYKGINSRLGFWNKNLLWIDPYYLNQIEQNSKIVLYGMGDFGRAYANQIKNSNKAEIIACIEDNPNEVELEDVPIIDICDLQKIKYDYVIIAIKNKRKAEQVRESLQLIGVDNEKILWFDQTEIFWKLAKINGWVQ